MSSSIIPLMVTVATLSGPSSNAFLATVYSAGEDAHWIIPILYDLPRSGPDSGSPAQPASSAAEIKSDAILTIFPICLSLPGRGGRPSCL